MYIEEEYPSFTPAEIYKFDEKLDSTFDKKITLNIQIYYFHIWTYFIGDIYQQYSIASKSILCIKSKSEAVSYLPLRVDI